MLEWFNPVYIAIYLLYTDIHKYTQSFDSLNKSTVIELLHLLCVLTLLEKALFLYLLTLVDPQKLVINRYG